MQDGWTRRDAPLDLSLETMSRMVATVFAPRTVVKATLLSGGLANTNYKIAVSGLRESFVLRVITRDPSACAREVDLYVRLRGAVPLPDLLYVDTEGATMGHPYTLAAFVAGTPMTTLLASGNESLVGAAGYAAGQTLAPIHAVSFAEPGEFGPELTIVNPRPLSPALFLEYLESALTQGKPRERLGAELADEILRYARERAALLADSEQEARLIHADYKATNLLLREDAGEWSVAAVLDWEFAFAGPRLVDYGVLLRPDRQLPAAFARQFARGYRDAGGALPEEWRRRARLMDLISLCTFLEAPDERGALVEDVTRLVRETLTGWAEDESP